MQPRQASPPTARVTAIVEALVDTPRSLTGLARHLDLSTATVHAILTSLSDAGWAHRDEATRLFSLGPGFLGLAQRAIKPGGSVEAVLRGLADELTMPVSLSSRVGEVLIVVHAAAPEGAMPLAVGGHTPYAVPFGPVFAAHDTPESQDAWLKRSGALRPAVVEELRAHLGTIRQRGFSVERLGPSALRLVQVLQDVRADATSEVLEPLTQALLSEVVQLGMSPRPGRNPVTAIVAPVTDPQGRLVHTLNAHPFRSLTSAEASAVAQRVVAAASRLSPAS